MEPPAKRRRQDSSPFQRSAEPDDETDELQTTSPHYNLHHDQEEGQTQAHDEGYQLATKRLEANQRLEATFAHIFEKYSQDFDGIGDEIDMETGEIVVNNGHLTGMRHEGDLGGAWSDDGNGDAGAAGDYDADEGFLLEDLPDNLFDDGPQNDHEQTSTPIENELNPSENDSRNIEGGDSEDKNEDNATVEELRMAPEPSAMVPASGSEVANMSVLQNFQSGAVATFAPNMYGNLFMSFLSAFGTFPPGTVPSISNNTNTPFNPIAPSANSTVSPNGQSPFPFMFNPWAMAGLLQAQACGQPGALMQLPQHWGQPGAAMEPQLPSMPASEKSKAERYKFPAQKGRTSIWAVSSRQEKDDQPTPKRGPGRPSGVKVNNPRSDKNANEAANQKDADDNVNRRMSGRVRRQTEYMGKVSWSEADKLARSKKDSSSQASASSANDRDGTDAVDELAMEGVETTPRSSQTSIRTSIQESVTKSKLGRVIPDSQDSATPPTSSAPRPSSQPKEQPTTISGSASHDANPSTTLSDDEAPIFLPQRNVPTTEVASTEPDSEAQVHEKAVPEANPQAESSTIPDAPKRRGPGRPRKSSTVAPVGPKSKADQHGTPAKPLSREIKNLHEVISDSPKFKLVPDAGDTTSQEEGGKLLRSSRSKNPAKSLDNITTEPRESQGNKPSSAVSKVNPKSTANPQPIVDSPAEERPPAPEPVANPETIVDSREQALAPGPASSPISTIPATDDGASMNDAEEPPAVLSQPELPVPSPRSIKEFGSIPRASPSTPRKSKPMQSSRPQTPRNTAIRTSRAPSSRRSLLSLVSANNSDSESDDSLDELNRPQPSPFQSRTAVASTIKTWHSSALTREVFRTPIKKRPREPISPSSVVKTPGGTIRTCGIDGYRCDRDFCFNCL
ncbi:hypothetical protein B0T10DRAFT_554919 [Thelonectria olida]|uniref:Myb-like DNA-binding domain protein n=1 Tax=Thelonectria olida TaxID=1576542 RepID=A0A9P8WKX5_9HYPO|nr:hypothetical protein B0T10DRAFT_554919 [Thelonectria olida]